ncbi:hypothetical protein ACTFIY_007084 [Dictyostelium cf. discoideum]
MNKVILLFFLFIIYRSNLLVQSQTLTNITNYPDTSQLQYDQSYLRICTNLFEQIVNFNTTLSVEYVYDACYTCEYQNLVVLDSSSSKYIIMPSTFGYKFNISVLYNGKVQDDILYLSFHETFGEYGIYDISVNISTVNVTKKIYHSVKTLKEPINSEIPIAVLFSILVGMAILWPFIVYLYKRSKRDSLEYQLMASVERENRKKDRLRSLDVFRGFSITIMIFVNYGGGGYWFFNHSLWNGLTVADLVFPWFVFIMGIAMPLSFHAMEKRGTPKRIIFQKLLRRSIILFALGLFINNGVNLQQWRILGVLQRFSISYLVVGSIMLFVPIWKFRSSPNDIININDSSNGIGGGGGGGIQSQQQHQSQQYNHSSQQYSQQQVFLIPQEVVEQQSILNGPSMNNIKDTDTFVKGNLYMSMIQHETVVSKYFSDIAPYWIQWVFALIIFSGWFLLMFLVPVSGCPTGYLGVGGLADQGRYQNCTGGAARLIDLKIFTEAHIFPNPTCLEVYKTPSYDPEGTVGYLTSIFLCFIGVQAGRIILVYKSNRSRLIRWMVWSVILCGIAAGLCGLTQNQGWIPINKNLWSPSYILLMAGFGFFVLTVMFIVIDIKKIWNGSPFIYVGMNPITIYCGHEILGTYFPFSFNVTYQTHSLYLLSNCIGVGCWLLIAYQMYRNKLFINI